MSAVWMLAAFATWIIGNEATRWIRIWRLGRRVARELPCLPTGVIDAFRKVTRGDLTPEQATLWLEWRESKREWP